MSMTQALRATADIGAVARPVAPSVQRSGPGRLSPLQQLVPMATAVAVALLVLVGILTARSVDLIVAIWAANAVAVGVWLRTGRGLAYDLSFGAVIAVGVMTGEVLAGNSVEMSVAFTAMNMVEIILAVLLARRFAPTLNLATVLGACRFVGCTAIIAPIPSAVLGAGLLSMSRGAPFLTAMETWWFGHALGLAVLTPLILCIDTRAHEILRRPARLAEWAVLFGLLALACWYVDFVSAMPLGFVFIPLLILIAARLRLAGVTLALAAISVCHVAATLTHSGHGGHESVAERIVYIQLMLLCGYMPILLVASLLEERDRFSERARAGQKRAEMASEAKSRLLANVAHEIKSPVAGVIGIGELWSTGALGPVTDQQKEMSDMLVRTARQVEALAHDLLDVARAESGAVKVELRPTDVTGLLEDIRRSTQLRPEARALKLEVVAEGDGLIALADSQRLAQVVDNLATNAVKYGAAGGSILFRARKVYDAVRIEVTDRGAGLTPEKQAQLFEPFNRLGLERSTIEGHGIGLALAKRLVELQGGSIGVVSAPGEGATFWIELPAA